MVLQRASGAGISDIIVPGVAADSWEALQEVCAGAGADSKGPALHPALGLHPMFMDAHRRKDLDRLDIDIGQQTPIAVGECGLDFYHGQDDYDEQMYLFIGQLELAVQHALPVIVHSRKSQDLILRALRQRPGLRAVMHSFSGSEQQAKQLIELGGYVSFGGPVTYNRAKKLQRLIMSLPLEGIMLESDAPDQPPVSQQGLRNEPANLADIAAFIAKLRGIPVEKLAGITTQNAQELFALR